MAGQLSTQLDLKIIFIIIHRLCYRNQILADIAPLTLIDFARYCDSKHRNIGRGMVTLAHSNRCVHVFTSFSNLQIWINIPGHEHTKNPSI